MRKHLLLTALYLLLPATVARGEDKPDLRFAPYAASPDHLWNRLHQALFVRETPDGKKHTHTTDPLLYRGGAFLLEGESHRRAIALLDELLAKPGEPPMDDRIKRLLFQRDLWAAFDYVGWYPDDWVLKSKYEPGAIALRGRVAKVIGRVALKDRELAVLGDNYALAVKSKQYATDHDPKHPELPFLPPDLFDTAGPWVRFHQTDSGPMAREHFRHAGGRAAHIVFLRLPGGRAATEQYLKELRAEEPKLEEINRLSVKQFPPGTMVAMVRRALAVDSAAKVRVTPLTEQVQIRVFRRIPENPAAFLHGDSGEQDMVEFLLDRQKLIAGEHGLRAVHPDDPAEPHFERSEHSGPFDGDRRPLTPEMPQLKTCIECHPQPGVYSLLTMERALRANPGASELFRTYAWDVELDHTVKAKTDQFNWGLLQGLLEGK